MWLLLQKQKKETGAKKKRKTRLSPEHQAAAAGRVEPARAAGGDEVLEEGLRGLLGEAAWIVVVLLCWVGASKSPCQQRAAGGGGRAREGGGRGRLPPSRARLAGPAARVDFEVFDSRLMAALWKSGVSSPAVRMKTWAGGWVGLGVASVWREQKEEEGGGGGGARARFSSTTKTTRSPCGACSTSGSGSTRGRSACRASP